MCVRIVYCYEIAVRNYEFPKPVFFFLYQIGILRVFLLRLFLKDFLIIHSSLLQPTLKLLNQ